MKNREMHCHSVASDGVNTEIEIIAEAQRLGLEFLALTDHDVIASKSFQSELGLVGIKTCDSVEISAKNYDLDKSLHLVSYAKIFHDSLYEVLEESLHGKMKMKWGQFDKLILDYGFIGDREGFDSFMNTKGRKPETSNKYDMSMYFMSYPENKDMAVQVLGELSSSDDIVLHFYLECLKRDGILYGEYGYESEEYEPSVEATVYEVVTKAGGIVSLAHPNVTFGGNKGGIPEFERTIGDYVQKGVNGVEINTMANSDWIHAILKVRQKYNLILTFGSDCHQIGYNGSDGKHSTIGMNNPNMSSLDLCEKTYNGISFSELDFLRFEKLVS